MAIDASSIFTATGSGKGVYSASGNLLNAGTIDMQDKLACDLLTVGGNYTRDNGTILLDTYPGGAGATTLGFNNTGGPGAQTLGGILVVDVAGASEGTFTLGNPDYRIKNTGESAIIAGAYGYALRQVDGDWFLQSPVYETYAQNLLGFMRLPTLRQRVGKRGQRPPCRPAWANSLRRRAARPLPTTRPARRRMPSGPASGTNGPISSRRKERVASLDTIVASGCCRPASTSCCMKVTMAS